MKTIKIYLSLTFLILLTYSCEPEVLTVTESSTLETISAETGDQKDDKPRGEG